MTILKPIGRHASESRTERVQFEVARTSEASRKNWRRKFAICKP